MCLLAAATVTICAAQLEWVGAPLPPPLVAGRRRVEKERGHTFEHRGEGSGDILTFVEI